MTGITDTTGGFGGGTLQALSFGSGASLTATPFTTAGGGSYTISSGQDLLTFPVSTNIGTGGLTGTVGSAGFAYDVSKSCAAPVTVSGMTLGPML